MIQVEVGAVPRLGRPLTVQEVALALHWAAMRLVAGGARTDATSIIAQARRDIPGCLGEVAFHAWQGTYPTSWWNRAPDSAGFELKTTERTGGDLLIPYRDRAKVGRRFALVPGDVLFPGWIDGARAMVDANWDASMPDPCWKVAQVALDRWPGW